jgi:hypothetical protein
MRTFNNTLWTGTLRDDFEKVHECYKCQLKVINPFSVVTKSLLAFGAILIKQGDRDALTKISFKCDFRDLQSGDSEIELRSIKLNSRYDYETIFPPNCTI